MSRRKQLKPKALRSTEMSCLTKIIQRFLSSTYITISNLAEDENELEAAESLPAAPFAEELCSTNELSKLKSYCTLLYDNVNANSVRVSGSTLASCLLLFFP